MFQPRLVGKHDSIHDTINRALHKCDHDARQLFLNNVVLAGGNTMFTGFKERLEQEMNSLGQQVKVIAPADRKYTTWIGGCILTSLDSMKDRWITNEMYYEHGPGIVHRMCPQTSYQAESRLHTMNINASFSDVLFYVILALPCPLGCFFVNFSISVSLYKCGAVSTNHAGSISIICLINSLFVSTSS